MSKERLEEIKAEYADTRILLNSEIQFLFKQAERVQELEEEVDRLKVWYGAYHRETKATSRLREENRRYREALKEIKKAGELKDYHTGRETYNFQARLANQVLEETEWNVSTSNGS